MISNSKTAQCDNLRISPTILNSKLEKTNIYKQ